MELHEFIQKTLEDIASGILNAHKSIESKDAYIVDDRPLLIRFDVGVTTEELKGLSKGGKINVAKIFQAGIDSDSQHSTSNTNRIEFTAVLHVKTKTHSKGSYPII